MKKILTILSLSALMLLSASCVKENFSKKVTGTITEEYLDGFNYFAWPSDAAISVFPGSTDNVKYYITSGAGTRVASFKTDIKPAGANAIDAAVALYPYNDAAEVVTTDGTVLVKTTLPATQTFTTIGQYGSGVCPLVAITTPGDQDFPFFAPIGGVSIKITGEQKIAKVELTANGGEMINGDVAFIIGGDNACETIIEGGTNKLTLDCGSEGIQLSQVAKDFVFFLPAGKYAQGFTATVVCTTGDVNVVSIPTIKTVHQARILNIARSQFAIYEDLNEGSDERANCYMINKAGGYYFDATVRGNGEAGLHPTFKDQTWKIAPTGAKLVWESEAGLVTGVSMVDGKLYFACSGKDGNAVVAATDDSGKILWSWHIWSTAPVPTAVNNPDWWTFMDRNLGAKEPMDAGLYFQWGRKDPFAGDFGDKDAFDESNGEGKYHPIATASAEVNTIQFAIENPDTYIPTSGRNNDWLLDYPQRYLWGCNYEADGHAKWQPFKSIYDPCPAGYEVATPTAISAGFDEGKENKGSYVTIFNGQLIVPAGGFIYTVGLGWYGKDSFVGLWTCSTSWGNVENAFRMEGLNDARGNYDRATGHPVRCMKMKK